MPSLLSITTPTLSPAVLAPGAASPLRPRKNDPVCCDTFALARGGDEGSDALPRMLASSGAAGGLSRQQWAELAEMVLDATRNRVNGVDVGLFLFFGPFAFAVSLKRLEGKITPTEMDALSAEAENLTPSQQRILAFALEELVDSRVARPVKEHVKVDEDTTVKVDARKLMAEFVASVYETHGTPNAAEQAAASLLATVDTVRILQNDAHRELMDAAEEDRAPNLEDAKLTEAHVEAVRVALQRVPDPLRAAAKQALREAHEDFEWPPNEEELTSVVTLRALLYEEGAQPG
ncbi:MAG: hypothetical protein AAF658_20445 [Myxococcota bacterium]